ncbi:MAG: alpha/beta fold hydrolase [Acidobacteriia bacterium]|nr:alpha/beta fold hydrolase [Terriglobia bacterium]
MKLSCLLCVFSAGLLMAQPAMDPAATARKALDLLLGEKYSDLFKMFTPELQTAMPEATLGKLVATQIKPLGAMEKIGDPSVRKAGTNNVVVIPVKFPAQSVNFQAAINGAGQLYILNLIPGELAWQRPSYSKPDTFREREVTVGEGDWRLPGTLTVPAGPGPFPAIALVHGNGPNDRDETVGGTRMFKDLAEGLATRGVVVLRYEKRTKQYGAKMAGMHGTTVQEETVDDAVAAAALLRAQKEVNPQRVYVLGHSLGGYVAPRIAEDDGKLAGLVILAGNARPLEDLIVEQSQSLQMNAQQADALKSLVARIKALEPADVDAPPILGMPVPYLLDLKGYDPAAVAKKLTIPLLILQGERDYQVTMTDFALWKAALRARKDVAFHSYPALNHLFVAGEGKSTEAEYRKPGHVAPEVIDDIAKWISK